MHHLLLVGVLIVSSSCVPLPHVTHRTSPSGHGHNNEDSTYALACGESVELDSVTRGRIIDIPHNDQPLPSSCHSFLYCHKCSLTTISAKLKSLTLIKSNVQLLEPAAALFFFYAGWTNLNTVRDLVFSKEASTARFEFSEINFIEKLTSMSDVNFKNCKIKNISSKSVTSFSSFTVVNSSIARIESNGIVAFSRTGVSFQNVFIEDLQELAVVVTGAGDLVLENVTIGRCKMPCFEVPSYENIKLVGHIFLNGTELSDDDVPQMATVTHVALRDQDSETSPLHSSGDDRTADVFIWCGVNTTLQLQHGGVLRTTLVHHQTARLPLENPVFRSPLRHEALGPLIGSQCSTNSFLTIINSLFHGIVLAHPVNLRLSNSYVEEVRGPLDFPNISNSRVGLLRDVAVSGQQKQWINASIGTIRDSSIRAEAFTLRNSSITEQIRNLTVEGSVIIQKSFIHSISSLRVLGGGYLVFQNSSINFLDRESIFLERGALISFSSVSISIWPQDAVSLVSYEQVLGYDYFSSSIWLPDLVSLRLTPATSLLPPTVRSVYSSLMDRRFCIIWDYDAVCDYSTAPMTDILHTELDKQVEPMPSRSIYRNAASIVLRTFGYSKEMVIENIGLIHFPKFFEHASSLLVYNSSFGCLHTQASSLVLHQTFAGLLKIVHVRQVSSVNSSVATVAADVNTADFRNTFIETIIKMKISNHTVFTNCRIQTIDRLAVFVSPNATLEIRNSTIDAISREGIIVEGNIILDRVHIASLSSFGLMLDNRAGGQHTMHKVTFGQISNKGIFNLTRHFSSSAKNNQTSDMEEQKEVSNDYNSAFSHFLSVSKNSFYQFMSYLPEVLTTIRDFTLFPNRSSSDDISAARSKKLGNSKVNFTITLKNNLGKNESNSQSVVINVPEDRAVSNAFTLDSLQRVIMPYHKFSVMRGMDNIVSPYKMCSHALHRDHPRPDGSSLQKYQIDLWMEFERCRSNPVGYGVAHEDHITRASFVLVQFDIKELWVQVLVCGLLGIVVFGVVAVVTFCLARRISFHRALRELEAEQIQATGDSLSKGNYFRRSGSRFGKRHPGSSDGLYLIKTPHNMDYQSNPAVYPPISPTISQKATNDDRESLNSSLSLTETTPDLCMRDGNDPSQSMQCLADSQTYLDNTILYDSPKQDRGHTVNQNCSSSPEFMTTNSVSRHNSFSVVRGVLARKLFQSSTAMSFNSSPTTSNVTRSTVSGLERNEEECSSSTDFRKVILPIPVCDGPDNFEMEIFF